MSRPRLNMTILENNYKLISEYLNKNELLACQMDEGVTVFMELNNGNIDCIMANPRYYKINGVTTWTMRFEELKKMYKEVLGNNKYKVYAVDKQNHKMREVFESLLEALMCMKTGSNYGGYRMRKLD
jgi:hypothetical protein